MEKNYYDSVTKTISAQNTFSDTITIKGPFNLSLYGTWVATAHLQRSFDGGTTWLDINSFTANTEQIGDEPEGAIYRFGVKTGNYTSGDMYGRLGVNTAIKDNSR